MSRSKATRRSIHFMAVQGEVVVALDNAVVGDRRAMGEMGASIMVKF